MKFSTKAEYGLRALIHLDKTGKKAVSLAFIAKNEGISLAYLERIFARLKKAKIVKAKLGPSGGYVLNKPASQINLLQIITALEGSVAPFSCVEQTCPVCKCKVHPVWVDLYKKIQDTLKKTKLSSIM